MYNGAVKVIYFDGVCVLCNGFVKWVIANDATKEFKFSIIGSDTYQKLLEINPYLKEVDSVIYQTESEVFIQGEAVQKIIQDLSTSQIVKGLSRLAPLFVLNFYYKVVANVRYKVFGKFDACPPLPPEWRDRFLP